MAYNEFTLGKVKSAFGISTREGDRFLPEIEPISPSSNLQESLKENPTLAIYGSVTNGTQWRFLRLVEQIVEIDLTDYPLPPVDHILGFLVWMVRNA